MSQINVYDRRWKYIGCFWAANGYGIRDVGGIITTGGRYLKRMS